MTRICPECGFDYTDDSDFEPGTARCWPCATRAYKRGMERFKDKNAKLQRLVDVLQEVADFGCGCRTEYWKPTSNDCRDEYPDDRDNWCLSCIAIEAIEKEARDE